MDCNRIQRLVLLWIDAFVDDLPEDKSLERQSEEKTALTYCIILLHP